MRNISGIPLHGRSFHKARPPVESPHQQASRPSERPGRLLEQAIFKQGYKTSMFPESAVEFKFVVNCCQQHNLYFKTFDGEHLFADRSASKNTLEVMQVVKVQDPESFQHDASPENDGSPES